MLRLFCIAIAVVLAVATPHFSRAQTGSPDDTPQCKRKTAGFFQQFAAELAGKSLALSIKSIPAPLSPAPADPLRGKELFSNPQKGACVECHQLNALPASTPQGTVGPALDGIRSE